MRQEIGNHPPEARDVLLTPPQPCTDDTLALHYTYYDADGDPQGETQIAWTCDGQPEPGFNNQTIIPSNVIAVGQIWSATVTPYDYQDPGIPVSSNSVTVTQDCIYSPPKALNVYITPPRPRSDQILLLNYDYFSPHNYPEGDTQIRWYMDGDLQPEFNDMTYVTSTATLPGQDWFATVRPHDGIQFGMLTQAMTVTINTPPSVSDVEITPLQPDNQEPLSLNYKYHDADGDPPNIIQIHWYRDDVLQSPYNNRNPLPPFATSPGEQWFATVTAHDGLEYSPVVTSNRVTITGSTISPYSYLYLPLVQRDTPYPWDKYYEDNNSQEQACPLDLGQVYYAYPDDVNDWYYVFLDQDTSLHVLVTNYSAIGQLAVYELAPGNDPPRQVIANDGRKLTTMELPNAGVPDALKNLPPGRYYIRVYSIGNTNSNQLYQLTVTKQ